MKYKKWSQTEKLEILSSAEEVGIVSAPDFRTGTPKLKIE